MESGRDVAQRRAFSVSSFPYVPRGGSQKRIYRPRSGFGPPSFTRGRSRPSFFWGSGRTRVMFDISCAVDPLCVDIHGASSRARSASVAGMGDGEGPTSATSIASPYSYTAANQICPYQQRCANATPAYGASGLKRRTRMTG